MKRNNLKVLMILFVATVCMKCTDAKKARVDSLGSEFKIELVNCDGSIAKTWVSSGKVDSKGNGYYFKEKDTDKLIQLTGDLIITEQ